MTFPWKNPAEHDWYNLAWWAARGFNISGAMAGRKEIPSDEFAQAYLEHRRNGGVLSLDHFFIQWIERHYDQRTAFCNKAARMDWKCSIQEYDNCSVVTARRRNLMVNASFDEANNFTGAVLTKVRTMETSDTATQWSEIHRMLL